MRSLFLMFLVCSFAFPQIARSQEGFISNFTQNDEKFFSPALRYRAEKKRSFVFPQFVSIILPGFDQWYEHQLGAAAVFTGTAVTGLLITNSTSYSDCDQDSDHFGLNCDDDNKRLNTLGSQMVLDSGFLSAYQSFRTAVRSQQPHGNFLFLKHEETIDQLLSSPFAFSQLSKPTTFVPLAIALAGGAIAISQRSHAASFTVSDAFYSSAYSFGAGTSEEAAFRGWLMPVTYHYFDNYFWSNTTTALIFAAAHYGGDNQLPIAQFAMGWYLGYLTQRNDWTLQQSIFVHTWWDVVVFAASYYGSTRSSSRIVTAPLLNATF